MKMVSFKEEGEGVQYMGTVMSYACYFAQDDLSLRVGIRRSVICAGQRIFQIKERARQRRGVDHVDRFK